MAYQQQQQQPFNPFSSVKLHMYGDVWEEGKREAPKLAYGVANNVPRFKVYANKPGVESKQFSFVFPPADMRMVLNTVMDIALSPEPKTIGFGIKSMFDNNGNKTAAISVISRVIVNKDSAGLVSISFHPKDEALCKFTFKNSYLMDIYSGDGEDLGAAEVSCMAARGWAENLREMTTGFLNHYPIDPKQNGGFAGGVATPAAVNQPAAGGWADGGDVPF